MAYASPVSSDGGRAGSYPIFRMPAAIIVARGFQLFFAFAVMAMAGIVMHGYVFPAEAFALVCGLFTIIIALYAILSEKVSSCRSGYNYWAVFALDLTMITLWLSSMAANAALRSSFNMETSATCYDDGSAVNADTCYYKRKSNGDSNTLAKRTTYFASNGALAIMSALSGVSALQMLLFVATFAYLAHQIRIHRQAEGRGVASDDAGVVEMKAQASATTTPAYPSGYAEAPSPALAQNYNGGGGGYAAPYDYPLVGVTPAPATQHSYGQPQQPAQGQYEQHPYSAAAAAAAPGAGQYYGSQ